MTARQQSSRLSESAAEGFSGTEPSTPEPPAAAAHGKAVDVRTARTRQKILETTEALIAEHGIHAVSARMISRACNMRNNVAVQYHFGTMEELYKAITVWRVASLDVIRRQRMMLKPWPTETRAVAAFAVELICLPHLELVSATGRYPYATFLCEYLPAFQPEGISWVVHSEVHNPDALNGITEILERLRDVFPQLAPDLANRRMTNAALLFLNVLRFLQFSPDNSEQRRQLLIADTLNQAIAVVLADPASA